MQPCHHTGQSTSWHNLLDATFQKKIWAKTKEAKLQTLGEPGVLPHTSGCLYHFAFSLLDSMGTNPALEKYLHSSWVTAMLWVCSSVRLPKKPGTPAPRGTYRTRDLCNPGDSHLLFSTCTLQRSVSCSTATTGRFTSFLSCEAPHGKELLQFIPKQWKLARLHKAAEDLAPLDSFI